MFDKKLPFLIFNKTFDKEAMPVLEACYRSLFNANSTREESDLVLYHPYENKWYYRDDICSSIEEHDEPPTKQYWKVLSLFLRK